MLFKFFLKYPLLAIIIHLVLGVVTKFTPIVTTLYLLGVLAMGVVEIYRQRDAKYITAYYLLYITGLEILYRIGKFYIFWELGKYACIIIAIIGLVARQKSITKALPFFIYFLLLLPGSIIAFVYGYIDEVYLRKIVMQHLSGPLCLFFSGYYFYKTKWNIITIRYLLRTAILPSIALVVLLFLGTKISNINYISASNFEASGGFGPNQVATMIGWGIMLLLFALFNRWVLTLNRATDIILLLLLIFRGLLTFSRGGILAAIGAGILPVLILMLFSKTYQRSFLPLMIRITAASFLLFIVAIVANNMTSNYLLYRYQGKSTSEVLTGRRLSSEYGVTTGRGELFMQEVESFYEYPFFGVGAGRGTIYREEHYHYTIPSHTEFSRLLGEHGIFGAAILLIIFIVFPLYFFWAFPQTMNRHWMLMFYLISVFTMFHSGMRLAMPGVTFGLAFIIINRPIQYYQRRSLPLESTTPTN